MPFEWGSVADWVAGIGAITALVFARSAARSAKDASELQGVEVADLRAQNTRRDDAERRAMASKVAVYVALGEGPGEVALRFVNAGDLPVYGMTVSCAHPGGISQRSYFVNGPHAGARTMRTMSAHLTELFSEAETGQLLGEGRITAACAFRDAVGRWWCRTAHGELLEAKDEEEATRCASESHPRVGGGADKLTVLHRRPGVIEH